VNPSDFTHQAGWTFFAITLNELFQSSYIDLYVGNDAYGANLKTASEIVGGYFEDPVAADS
jgi:hypothetical protein